MQIVYLALESVNVPFKGVISTHLSKIRKLNNKYIALYFRVLSTCSCSSSWVVQHLQSLQLWRQQFCFYKIINHLMKWGFKKNIQYHKCFDKRLWRKCKVICDTCMQQTDYCHRDSLSCAVCYIQHRLLRICLAWAWALLWQTSCRNAVHNP